MQQQNQAILTTRLSKRIINCTFTKKDLQELCEILQASSDQAAADEITHYNPIGQTEEQIYQDIEMLKQGFEIWVTVQGFNDQEVFGTIQMVFNSPRFPDRVKKLYINSKLFLENQLNWFPRNHFELVLDFTKPQLFNPSPNESNFIVAGQNELWVNGLYHTIIEFLKSRTTQRGFFKRSFYHWLLLFVGFPFAFGMVSRFSGLINRLFGEHTGILKNVVDVYIFYISLLLFTTIFEYARWIFPIVEYRTPFDNAQKHKTVLVILVLGIAGKLIYDLIKAFFW